MDEEIKNLEREFNEEIENLRMQIEKLQEMISNINIQLEQALAQLSNVRNEI